MQCNAVSSHKEHASHAIYVDRVGGHDMGSYYVKQLRERASGPMGA